MDYLNLAEHCSKASESQEEVVSLSDGAETIKAN